MGVREETDSTSPGLEKEANCAPCRALSDLLRGMPGMRDHSARQQPSTGTAEQGTERPQHDCMTCRVLGTTVCGACSAYLAGHLYMVRPASRGHRVGLAAGAALFAGLGVLRAIN